MAPANPHPFTWDVVPVDAVRGFLEARPHPNVLEPLHHPERKRFIAVFDGTELVAAASLERRALGIDQLGAVLVDEARRNAGLGRFLMDAVRTEARRSGARLIACGVYRRDPDVSPYYRTMGFRVLLPYVPGAASRFPFGALARGLARLFRVEAGADPIRIMARRP